jgi:predicted DNA-binding protein YlxM (UPF0122 family)
VASQFVSVDKRYRISLLLDAYGELLTNKQRVFMRHYYEEDLSYGEIAREHGVSRQAIFDSVKHGAAALEEFEEALHLVRTGWLRVIDDGLTPDRLADVLASIRQRLSQANANSLGKIGEELDALVAQLRPASDGE